MPKYVTLKHLQKHNFKYKLKDSPISYESDIIRDGKVIRLIGSTIVSLVHNHQFYQNKLFNINLLELHILTLEDKLNLDYFTLQYD